MEKIYLATSDKVKIAANFYPVAGPEGWILYVHMMPATKESWNDLARALQELGYEGLAIDLRGHGESDEGPNGYRNFSDEEHQRSILDVEAAVDYLIRDRLAAKEKIYLVGASIGANLSLQYLSEHPEFTKAVLLSPGLDYRGIQTEPMAKKLRANQKVFFASSRDDGSNAEENEQLSRLASTEVNIKIYPTAGHGTTILEKEPELKNLIIDFLTKSK